MYLYGYRMNMSKTYLNVSLSEQASCNIIIFAFLVFIEKHCLDRVLTELHEFSSVFQL